MKPFQATNPTTFTFTGAGDKTEVSWHMQGGGGFMGKVMNAFMNMDAAVGKDFEAGLANMKTFDEAKAKEAPPPPPPAAAAPEAAADAGVN